MRNSKTSIDGPALPEPTPPSRSARSANDPEFRVPELLNDFDYHSVDALSDKLHRLRRHSENLELWADFDNTLTTRNCGVYEALRNALPVTGQMESDIERRVNLAKEQAGMLSIEENIIWTKNEIGRYSQYAITSDDIVRAVEAVRLRPGARRLFTFCHKAGINRHIISASIADVIELIGLRPTHIHSNKLHIRDGIVIGWDEEHILHSHNKHFYTTVVLTETALHYKGAWKIILGDSYQDAQILPGKKVLRIRVRGRHGNSESYLAQSFNAGPDQAAYDLVLRTESLVPVVRLLKWLTKKVP